MLRFEAKGGNQKKSVENIIVAEKESEDPSYELILIQQCVFPWG